MKRLKNLFRAKKKVEPIKPIVAIETELAAPDTEEKIMEVEMIDKKENRRRLNAILEICKFRKDKKAMECFDSDCDKTKETKIVSSKTRRRGDGSTQKREVDTGNIIVSCEVHGWKQLCSVSQLDSLPMPKRTTTVNDGDQKVSDPESSNVIDR